MHLTYFPILPVICQRYTVTVPRVNTIPLPACRNKARSQPFLPSSVGRASAPPVDVKGNDTSWPMLSLLRPMLASTSANSWRSDQKRRVGICSDRQSISERSKRTLSPSWNSHKQSLFLQHSRSDQIHSHLVFWAPNTCDRENVSYVWADVCSCESDYKEGAAKKGILPAQRKCVGLTLKQARPLWLLEKDSIRWPWAFTLCFRDWPCGNQAYCMKHFIWCTLTVFYLNADIKRSDLSWHNFISLSHFSSWIMIQ